MLDSCDANLVVDELWPTLTSIAALPVDASDFFDKTGPSPVAPDCQRRFRRFFLRTKAILEARNQQHGVYVQDVSRQGFGFLAPLQLLPREKVELWLPGKGWLGLSSTRCRRIAERCYECGAVFGP